MAWYGTPLLQQVADQPRLLRELVAALGTSREGTRLSCKALHKRGYATFTEGILTITDAGRAVLASGTELRSGPESRNVSTRAGNTLRARAWRAMRMRDGFSLDDLLTMLCDGSEAYAEKNLGDYIRALACAGYLLALPRRGDGPHPQRYRLRRDRNTGREAPAFNKATRTLTDLNTGEVFRIPTRAELAEQAELAELAASEGNADA